MRRGMKTGIALGVFFVAIWLATYVETGLTENSLNQVGDFNAYLPVILKEPTPTATLTPTPTITPIPTRTSTPGPTPAVPNVTPIAGANYVVSRWHHLTPCENHGMLRLKVTVYDVSGNPLDGITVVRYTNTGDFAGYDITGAKGPGQVEFTFEGPSNGGNWHATIEMVGETSETAWELRTDLGDEDCEVTGEPGNSFKHHSYDVDFRKVR